MSYFFDHSRASQASSYQNTAFFQNGSSSRTSIFDQPAQSESQIAYELFNIDSKDTDSKQRSIISKLDVVDRNKEQPIFHQLNSFSHQPNNSKPEKIESQESKDSRMTFGNKMGVLYESKVEEHKSKKMKFYEEPPSKEKGFSMSRRQSIEPTSNFSLFKGELSSNLHKEPQSMPLTFDNKKEAKQPSKKHERETVSSNSSSISIDFQEIRQRQMNEEKVTARPMQSMRIINEKAETKGSSIRSECSFKEPVSNVEDFRPEQKETIAVPKEKKFQFNLNKSKVEQPKIQRIFISKSPQHHPETNYETTPIKKVFQNDYNQTLGLFRSRAKEGEEKILESNNKIRESERKVLNFLKNPVEDKQAKPEKSSFNLIAEKQIKKPIIQREQRPQKPIEVVQKEPEPPKENNETIQKEKEKRESIGLKEQLKKLSSRPTEKIELKSIAFTKGFKFRPKAAPQEKPKQAPKEPHPKEPQLPVPRSFQPEQKPRTSLTFKEEKVDFIPPKSSKSNEFTRFMVSLMELQQQSESLKHRTIQSRNSYRQLAILNEDINRRIDDALRAAPRR